jgi:hypothetical protein
MSANSARNSAAACLTRPSVLGGDSSADSRGASRLQPEKAVPAPPGGRLANLRNKCLKILHLLFAGMWIGGTASLTALICLYHPQSNETLVSKSSILLLLDIYIIAPGAIGCLITGLIYTARSPRLLRIKWVLYKIAANIAFIAVGGLFVVPWLERSIEKGRLLAAPGSESVFEVVTHMSINAAQWAVIVFVVTVSVVKPWGSLGDVAKGGRNHS